MSNLTAFLRPEHHNIGLTLQDEDVTPFHILLQKDGTIIKTFDQHASLAEILHEADQALEQSKSGISFVKEVSNG